MKFVVGLGFDWFWVLWVFWVLAIGSFLLFRFLFFLGRWVFVFVFLGGFFEWDLGLYF